MRITTKKQAKAAIRAGRDFLFDKEVAERRATNQPLVGGFFRRETSGGGGITCADRRYVYTAVTGLDEDAQAFGWRFEIDGRGVLMVDPKVERIYPHIYLTERISRDQFMTALLDACATVQKLMTKP